MQVFFKNLLQKLSQGQEIRSREIRSCIATYWLVDGSWHCHLFGAGRELRFPYRSCAMGAGKWGEWELLKIFKKYLTIGSWKMYNYIIKKGGKEKLNMWAIVRPEPCNEIWLPEEGEGGVCPFFASKYFPGNNPLSPSPGSKMELRPYS